jgi:hypothetical protein
MGNSDPSFCWTDHPTLRANPIGVGCLSGLHQNRKRKRQTGSAEKHNGPNLLPPLVWQDQFFRFKQRGSTLAMNFALPIPPHDGTDRRESPGLRCLRFVILFSSGYRLESGRGIEKPYRRAYRLLSQIRGDGGFPHATHQDDFRAVGDFVFPPAVVVRLRVSVFPCLTISSKVPSPTPDTRITSSIPPKGRAFSIAAPRTVETP